MRSDDYRHQCSSPHFDDVVRKPENVSVVAKAH